ncbi:MAG: T9SS type A sorting domain-containing protein [Flavobacteriales bacterium]|nr:T9SS type A sorting domain-containing protein [Flavobacteriales bacterium]
MKKALLFMVFCACTTFNFAQVTIDGTNIGIIDYKITEVKDTSPSIAITAPGANQTWNYTNISNHETSVGVFQYVNWTPHASKFPTANLAMMRDNGAEYWYYNKASNSFKINGAVGDIFDFGVPVDFVLNPGQTIANFPLNYQDAFSDSSTSIILGDTSLTNLLPLGGIFDSVRVTINIKTNVNVDGWGSLTTPLGTFDALRVKTVSHVESKFAGGTVLPFVGTTWVNLFTENDTTNQYSWWSDSVGYSLMSVDADQNDVVEEVTYLSAIPGPSSIQELVKSNISIYPNPSNGMFQLRNLTGSEDIFIYDASGRLAYQKQFSGDGYLDLRNLNNGIYKIQIIDEGQMIFSKSLIIEE